MDGIRHDGMEPRQADDNRSAGGSFVNRFWTGVERGDTAGGERAGRPSVLHVVPQDEMQFRQAHGLGDEAVHADFAAVQLLVGQGGGAEGDDGQG